MSLKALLVALAVGVAVTGGASVHAATLACPDALALNGGPLNAGAFAEACPSARRGFIAVYRGPDNAIDEQVWWSTDSGRHWYRTNRVGPLMFASARRAYWVSRGSLYRVARWPSAIAARRRCRNFSHRGACVEPAIVNAGLRSALLLRLDDAVFADAAFVPLPDRAVLPVSNTRGGLPPRAVLVRGLGVRVIHLPDLDADVCGGAATPVNPRLIVIAACRAGLGVGAWTSTDGGETWSSMSKLAAGVTD